jgi:hypothetical protein
MCRRAVTQHGEGVNTFTTNETLNCMPSGCYGYCFRLSYQILPSHQGNSLGLSHSCFLVLWLCYHTVKHEFSEFTHSVAELPMLHLTHYPSIYLLSSPKGNTVSYKLPLHQKTRWLSLIGQNAINSELSVTLAYFHRNVPCLAPSCKNIPHMLDRLWKWVS